MFRKLLSLFIYGFYRLWVSTWKKVIFKHEEFEKAISNKEPLIFAFWHGDELALLCLAPEYRLATMTSTSKDGELMRNVLSFMDIPSSRGSSTRGGVSALKGLIRLARSGRTPLIAVDGPKGPYHKVKLGVFELSKFLNAKIVPVGAAPSRAIVFEKSWNKAYLPSLFSTLYVVWGKPLPAIGRDEDLHDEKLKHSLEMALNAVGQEASKLVAQH